MFKQKAHLLKHLCSVHRNIINCPESGGRYKCCFCTLYFDTLQELVRHLSGHHNNLLLSKNLHEWQKENGRNVDYNEDVSELYDVDDDDDDVKEEALKWKKGH